METVDIITQGAAAAGFAKVLVDLIKMSPIPSPSVVLPIFAFICAEGCAFLLAASDAATVFNRPTITLTILIGIAATAGAIGMTEAQKKASQ
jgi:hypothetical protein